MKTAPKLAALGLLFLLGLLMMRSCLRAEWHRSRIKPGMTLSQMLDAADGWSLFSGISQPPSDNGQMFWALSEDGGTYSIHVKGKPGSEPLGSKEELVQAVQQQMGDGHPWHTSLTYLGYPRSTFGVSFDAQGRVQEVSAVAGRP